LEKTAQSAKVDIQSGMEATMNHKYLGDALDHFKGSLIRRLQSDGLLRDLAVDPMATDAEQWTDDDYRLYAQLLEVDISRVHRSPNPPARKGCLSRSIKDHDGDLFLDPDTGVYTGNDKKTCRHVEPEEIVHLLGTSRIVAVYQHRLRKALTETEKATFGAVQNLGPLVSATSYVGQQLSILFFSKDPNRIAALAGGLRAWLGTKAARVYPEG
jgi:hypothetical protein